MHLPYRILMNLNKNVRVELKKLANQIETLAKQVQKKVSSATGKDILDTAQEMIKNSTTFTFMLGGLLHSEDKKDAKSSTSAVAQPVSNVVAPNYHSVRDSKTGRFVRRP